MAKKFTVPNWSQSVLAREIGLDPKEIAVENENDQYISFLQFLPRKFFLVKKADGSVVES